MIGSADTLSRAKIGLQAQELVPKGGAEVWRRFMRYLREHKLILEV